MLIPISVTGTNQVPTETDYEELKDSVSSFLNDGLQDFYAHKGTMEMFVRNEMPDVAVVFCYLSNKQDNDKLTEEENSLYTKLNKELQNLQLYDIDINKLITKITSTDFEHSAINTNKLKLT